MSNYVQPKRAIETVYYAGTGRIYDVDELLGAVGEDRFEMRRDITDQLIKNDSNPSFLCAHCRQPVVQRNGLRVLPHFAHKKNTNDCIYKTDLQHREAIKAGKYNGINEGRRHFEGKMALADTIKKDSFFDNETVRTEQWIKGSDGPRDRRRPDINVFDTQGRRIIFELQVSTQSIKVIAEREHFYAKESMYIIWVFLTFDASSVTTQDIANGGFHHIFVFDEYARERTEASNTLVLRCYYLDPKRGKIPITEAGAWRSEFIVFDDLTFDTESKRIYLHDLKKERGLYLERIKKIGYVAMVNELLADAIQESRFSYRNHYE